MPDKNPPLQLPCSITKISTVQAGGWSVTFHVPESEAGQVRGLVGSENRQAFIMFLVRDAGAAKPSIPEAKQDIPEEKPCKKKPKRAIKQP